MPTDTPSFPPYLIDEASARVLKGLKPGRMASFYAFSNSQRSLGGLVVAKATQETAQQATREGTAYRKQMNVKQFCKGVLLCEEAGILRFVWYGGNLSLANLERLILRMRKEGDLPPPLPKLLKGAVFDERSALAQDDVDLERRRGELGDHRSDAEPREDEAGEPESSAALLASLEEGFLSEETFRKDFDAIVAETIAPLALVLGVALESAEPEAVAHAFQEVVSRVTPSLLLAMEREPAVQGAVASVFEAFSAGLPLGDPGAALEFSALGGVRALLADTTMQQLLGAHVPEPETAIHQVILSFRGEDYRVYTARTVTPGMRLDETVPVEPFGRSAVQALAQEGRDLRSDLETYLQLGSPDATNIAEEVVSSLHARRAEFAEQIQPSLDRLKQRWPVTVVDAVVLPRLRETLSRLERVLADFDAHLVATELRARIPLTAPRVESVVTFGRRYAILVSDEDLEGVAAVREDGTVLAVREVTREDAEEAFVAPVAALAALQERESLQEADIHAAVETCARTLVGNLDALVSTAPSPSPSPSPVVVRTSALSLLLAALEQLRAVHLLLQARIVDTLPEYQTDAHADPDALLALHRRCISSVQEVFAARAPQEIRVRLAPAPFKPAVWVKGGHHEAAWKEDQERLEGMGYGPKRKGWVFFAPHPVLALEGGKGTLAGMLALLGELDRRDGIVLMESLDDFKAHRKAILGAADEGKLSQALRTVDRGRRSREDEARAAALAAIQKEALPLKDVMSAVLPTSRELSARADAQRRDFRPVEGGLEEAKRNWRIESLMADPQTQQALLLHFRAEHNEENLMFYVAVVPEMSPYRPLFPVLLAGEGKTGVDRTRWLYETFVANTAPYCVNVASGIRGELASRYGAGILGASAVREFRAVVGECVGLFGDVLSRLPLPRGT